MAQDITGIIRTLHTSVLNRCRERLDAAALIAKDLNSRDDRMDKNPPAHEKTESGVTSVLKRRHGL